MSYNIVRAIVRRRRRRRRYRYRTITVVVTTTAAAAAAAGGPMNDRRRVLPSTSYPRHRFSLRDPLVAAAAATATRRQRLRGTCGRTFRRRIPNEHSLVRSRALTDVYRILSAAARRPQRHDRRRETTRAFQRRSRAARRTAVPQPGLAAHHHRRRSRGPFGSWLDRQRTSGLQCSMPCV